MALIPTIARKAINRYLEDISKTNPTNVLFVGVNYQWDSTYRKLFNNFVTLDIRKNVIEPDIYGDIKNCPKIPSESFDLVIMVGIWELLGGYRELDNTRREIQRILKKGGKIVFGFPGMSFSAKRKFYLERVVTFLSSHFEVEKIESIYYKSNIPFYIIGIARK